MDCKGSSKSCGKMTKLAWLFVIVGAINWGLVGFFSFDLVAWLFGDMSFLSRLIYAIVGISGIMLLCGCKSCKKDACAGGKCDMAAGTCDSSSAMSKKMDDMKDHAKAMMDDAKDIAEDMKEEMGDRAEAVKDAVMGDDK